MHFICLPCFLQIQLLMSHTETVSFSHTESSTSCWHQWNDWSYNNKLKNIKQTMLVQENSTYTDDKYCTTSVGCIRKHSPSVHLKAPLACVQQSSVWTNYWMTLQYFAIQVTLDGAWASFLLEMKKKDHSWQHHYAKKILLGVALCPCLMIKHIRSCHVKRW